MAHRRASRATTSGGLDRKSTHRCCKSRTTVIRAGTGLSCLVAQAVHRASPTGAIPTDSDEIRRAPLKLRSSMAPAGR